MKRLIAPAVATATLLLASLPLAAHSLHDVESGIQEQERYAQFVDREAPDFHLAGANGDEASLSDFAGKVVVLNFIYVRCTDDCPTHMVLIGRLQSMINAAEMAESVQFVTIATDTEGVESTRELMRGYGESFGLDPSNWQFLFRTERDPVDTTVKLADAYGLKFMPIEEEAVQMHGVVTHVIDQTGRMRARFHGLGYVPGNLVSYVNALIDKDHSRH
ncbi:SCO family protein [Aquisalimonas lutea]|uniref:SCO family protein n=1 Tax=Aquisalimonas lutea TaxID=1327750 RepID=UPI0025B3A6F8|nr:SCO family protein [Aquisalimonas lutea]MDN3519070.1 SCO family protein [Aquisalimonas lutea]